jgi:hypothetical protein
LPRPRRPSTMSQGATLGRATTKSQASSDGCEQCRRVCPAPGGSCGDAERRQ